jgi:hypothetical protein
VGNSDFDLQDDKHLRNLESFLVPAFASFLSCITGFLPDLYITAVDPTADDGGREAASVILLIDDNNTKDEIHILCATPFAHITGWYRETPFHDDAGANKSENNSRMMIASDLIMAIFMKNLLKKFCSS